MKLTEFKKKSERIPDIPGVYFFLDARKKILYIGKATSLRDRTRSYFSPDVVTSRGPLITTMVEKARTIEWRITDSVLEALILEANLIKHYKPHYNTLAKDDKSFNYVVITKEEFPRILLVRGKNLEQEFPKPSQLYLFGPFPHGLQLKEALKLVRKIFPYRDTCIPAPEMLAQGKKPKACFNHHIGLCPGVCSGEIGKQAYRRTIRHIVLLFQGKKKELLVELGRDMKAAAKREAFEAASVLRKQIFALTYIKDISLIKDENRDPHAIAGKRIEAYDVAHLQGSANVGVMTVVSNGVAEKDQYRKFRIRAATPGDDSAALREILSRRLGHDEWPLPQLIVVDGGAIQMNAAQKVLTEYGIAIPIVGVVKDEKHRPKEIRGRRDIPIGSVAYDIDERAIILANAEAHRFAITFHRNTSRKEKGKY